MNNWKRLNLGELGKSYSGLNGKTKNDFGKGSPYIPYLRIFEDGKIDLSRMDYVSIDKHERQNSVQVGDLFFTTSSETINEVGMTSVLIDKPTEKTYLNSFCFGFRLSNFDDLTPEYARYLFRSLKVRKDISLLGQGSTRYNLPKTILFKKLFVDVPDIPYQQKIAKILNTIDAVIEKTEHAIAKYQAIKKGMMHDLFTRGVDVKTGQLRPSFKDAPESYKESALGMIPKGWDVEELGNVGDIKMCKRIFSYQTKDKGDIPFYKIGTFGKKPDAFITRKLYKEFKSKYSFPRIGDVLISASGTIGRLVVYNGEDAYFQDSNIVWLENNYEIISNKYLRYIFPLVRFQTEGSTIQRLYNSVLRSGLFQYPNNTIEQDFIIKYIESIDDLIQKEQKILAKHQNIKKGVMQDLLTGKVEVKV